MSKRLNRFLIVDRTEAISRQFSRIGRRLGYSTDTAETLDEFIAAVTGNPPTVVLIDLQSVDGEGHAHLKALRNNGCDPQVILTSDSNLRSLETSKQLAEFLGLTVIASLRSSVIVNVVRHELCKARQSRTEITCGDLKTAIDAGDIRPYYRPRASHRARYGWPIREVEAIPRWHINGSEIVAPEEFLPLAEDRGLLPAITRQLLEQIVRQLASWRSRRIGLSAATNLPASALADCSLPDFLQKLMEDAKLETSSLTLEVSEALAMSYSTAAIDVLNRLRAMGFRLSICEFGTSYSSLEQLHRLRFDELKVDPSLVLESRISGDARTILEATVLLAQKLGLSVCADGVDSQRTLQYLGRIGCNKAQGDYVSLPLSPDTVESKIYEWNTAPAVASCSRDGPRRTPPGRRFIASRVS